MRVLRGMHKASLMKMHEPETRIGAVEHWVESDAFTPRERAALQWTDVLTKLEGGKASDEDYAAVSEFFQEKIWWTCRLRLRTSMRGTGWGLGLGRSGIRRRSKPRVHRPRPEWEQRAKIR